MTKTTASDPPTSAKAAAPRRGITARSGAMAVPVDWSDFTCGLPSSPGDDRTGATRTSDTKVGRNHHLARQTMPADYYSLLVRAVTALDSNTVKARQVVYGAARDALVKQARAIQPALREADLTRERLKLERAIRKVEREELESSTAKKSLIRLARHIEALLADFAVR